MMHFDHDGRRYYVLMGSDVQNDTTYLELRDVTEASEDEAPELLFGERSDDTGKLSLLSLQHIGSRAPFPVMVPVEVVERFIALMREHL